jgi:hypothetical protein
MRQLFILLLALFGRIDAAELHAILFIDSLAENIEVAMERNYSEWEVYLEKISKYTGLDIKRHIFIGHDLKFKRIDSFFRTLSFARDDVVVFYFSGHGYRNQKKEDPWPYLCLSEEHISLDFSQITEILIGKNPRLLLSMADCCNNYIELLSDSLTKEECAPQLVGVVKQNYRRLFLETDGAIVVSSSLPGEFSWAWPYRGSCFTLAFFDALKREVRHPEGTEWAIVLEKAGESVKDLQTPQYLIMQ